ncbi:hypothetical protein NLU13_9796 [Sarocladium strictum]|uniref:FAS1 domain-containing protein n=1 Tax=Sarocladium strictum TaxID=5046 RepID=A0AA39L3J8_SARSR|nr:hypothetical protein NLU13_9796 [Sarocladium strictum]
MRRSGAVRIPLAVVALASSACAFVVPPAQLPLVAEPHQSASGAWWDSLRDLASESSLNPHVPNADELVAALEGKVDRISAGFEDVAKSLKDLQSHIVDLVSKDDEDVTAYGSKHGHREYPDYTIYELIKKSNYTKKFAAAIDDYPSVVKILNGTDAGNHTLCVPLDEAFEHLPEHGDKPSKEFMESALLYHIGLGDLPAVKLLKANTIPTAYNESWLGNEPQRLRTSVGLGGLKLNFYSKVVAADFKAKNGIVHGIREILIPPPMVGRELTLFPGEFSTLLLAYEKTNFVDFIHNVKMVGSTVFAPSNKAFQKLGPRANAFLFNTETGLKYLKAILKYHIVANATLYTDAFYDKTDSADEGDSSFAGAEKREHFDLVTLLHDLHVSVDILEWASLKFVTVNGFAGIQVRDGVAKNGVIHVLDRVLIPPHKHEHKHAEVDNELWEGEMDVNTLKSRLDDYV